MEKIIAYPQKLSVADQPVAARLRALAQTSHAVPQEAFFLAFTAMAIPGFPSIEVQRLRVLQRDCRSSFNRNKQAHHLVDRSGKQQRWLPQP